MKQRINLFKKTPKETLPPIIRRQILTVSTLVSGLFFLIFLAFTLLQFRIYFQKQDLLKRKRISLESLLENKTFVAKMAYFSGKSAQMRKFNRNDVDHWVREGDANSQGLTDNNEAG